jgi:hypothetical protein
MKKMLRMLQKRIAHFYHDSLFRLSPLSASLRLSGLMFLTNLWARQTQLHPYTKNLCDNFQDGQGKPCPYEGVWVLPMILQMLPIPMRAGSADFAMMMVGSRSSGFATGKPLQRPSYHRIGGECETFVRIFVSILRERRLEFS